MIRTLFQLSSVALIAVALVAIPGCGGSKATPSKSPAKTAHTEGDGHDHSKDKDDHSGHDHKNEGKTK